MVVRDTVRADAPHRIACSGGSPLLLAIDGASLPTTALLRARNWATILGVELRIVRVLPRIHRRRLQARPRRALHQLQAAAGRVPADKLTVAWTRMTLGTMLPAAAMRTRVGDFGSEVVRHAAAMDATMVVLPCAIDGVGTLSVRLARELQRPIMIARSTGVQGTILAATDLLDPEVPVLHKAVEIAAYVDGRVVAVHNLPGALDIASRLGGLGQMMSKAARRRIRSRVLTGAANRLGSPVLGTFLDETSPVDAILDRARQLDADTILVGARPRSWWSRLVRRSVAAEVVDAADRTVIVTPLERV